MTSSPGSDGSRGGFLGRVARAGMWAFLMRALIRVAQLARTIVLARILLPSDFGVMAIAVVSLLLLETVSRTGFRNALVQLEGDPEPYLDTAWTVEALRGLLAGGVVAVAAPLIGGFFGSPEAVPVVQVMALTAVITGLTNPALVRLDRELRFDRVLRFELSQRITEVVVAIVAAIVLRSVWALVIGAVAGTVVRVIASFVVVPRRPRFAFDRPRAAEMYSYGKWIYGTNLLDFVGNEADDIVVGRLGGTEPLGLYRMAYTLSQSVVTEVAQTTNQVVFPAFARLKATGGDLISGLVHSTHFVAFLAMPAVAGLIAVGDGFVRVLLGPAWLEMVPAMKILAAAGAVGAIAAVVSTLFEGVGRPSVATRFSLVRMLVLLVVIYPAVSTGGLLGAAWAVLAATVVAAIPLTVETRRFAGTRFRELLKSMAWPVVNAAVMGVLVFGFSNLLDGIDTALELVGAVAVAFAGYGLMAFATSRFFDYAEPKELASRFRNRTGA